MSFRSFVFIVIASLVLATPASMLEAQMTIRPKPHKERADFTAGAVSQAMGIDTYRLSGTPEDLSLTSYAIAQTLRSDYRIRQVSSTRWELTYDTPFGSATVFIDYFETGGLASMRLTISDHVIVLEQQVDGSWAQSYLPGQQSLPLPVLGGVGYDLTRFGHDYNEHVRHEIDTQLGSGVTDDILQDLVFGTGGGRGYSTGSGGNPTSPPDLDPKKHDAACWVCGARAVAAGGQTVGCIAGVALGGLLGVPSCIGLVANIATLNGCFQNCTSNNIAVDVEDFMRYLEDMLARFDLSNYAHSMVEDLITQLGQDFDPTIEGDELVARLGIELDGFLQTWNVEQHTLADQVDLFLDTQLFTAGGLPSRQLALP